jgi:hypothetical protein
MAGDLRSRWLRPMSEQLEDRTLLSTFYNLDVIAETGQAGLTGILQDVSINDKGKVAFVGKYSDGEGILVGDGSSLTNINPSFSHDSSRTFGPAVQINNSDQVAAVDRDAVNGTESRLRTWDADGNVNSFGNTYLVYADASVPPNGLADFDGLSSLVSLSNNGNIAYAAFDYGSNSWQLRLQNDVLPDPLDVPAGTLPAPQSLRPMAANGAGSLGYVVVRDGNTPTSPIMLYGNLPGGAFFGVPIAGAGTASRFSALGQSPGISSDGRIVVFYGVDASGPGIFASVSTSSQGRQIVRIAGADPNGPISQFLPDEPIGVNATESSQGGVTVTYVAYDANGSKGVYATRLTFVPPANDPTNFQNPTSFVVSDPIPVVQAGDLINGLGAVQDVHLYQPINNTGFGQIAVWIQGSSSTGIVRATSWIGNSVTVSSNGPTISATFQPGLGMTLAQAAAALGVDHFTWTQEITNVPSTWAPYVAVGIGFTNPDGQGDAPEVALNSAHQLVHQGNPLIADGTPVALQQASLPLGDPIQQVPGHQAYAFFNSDLAAAGSFPWLIADHNGSDDLPGYWNEPGELASFTTANTLLYSDRPISPPGSIPAGEALAFETSLVGVRADGSIVMLPKGIGTSFAWRSNTMGSATGGVTSIQITYFDPASYAPPVGSGSVFNVQADDTLPPANVLVLAPINNEAVTPGTLVGFTAAASDPFPDATVTYSLAAGAPGGASIDPKTGIFTWTPTAAQAGQVYSMTVNATDNSTPALLAAQSFVVNVRNQLSVTAVTELEPPTPGPLQVAIDFNEGLQSSAAQSVALYKIAQEGSSSLPIQSAVYSDSGSQHRMLLTVAAGTVVAPGFYHVYIDAANLTATNGDQGAPKTDQLWVDVTSENTLKPITVQPDGSFAVSGNSEFLGYDSPTQIVAGNFTGNGNTDLVVITSGRHEEILNGNDTFVYDPVLLLKSNGDGTYAAPVPIALGGQYQAVSLNTVDWNHDGAPDLVVGVASNFDEYVHPQTEQFYVLLNDGHGNFTNAPETPIPVADPQSDYLGANGISVFQATGLDDLSGNGNIDIVHLGQPVGNDFNLEVIGKDQYVGYTPQLELPLGANGGIEVTPSQILFADLNGDGKPDIITRDVADYGSLGDFSVILSTPTGYAPGVTYSNSLATNDAGNPLSDPVALGIGHFTGSAYNDIAAFYGSDIEIYQNDGHGSFTELPPIQLPYAANAASFTDVNKDGVPDLVITTALGDPSTPTQLGVWTLIADGHGGFTPTTTAPIPLAGNDASAPSVITMADLDHDGFLDLVLGRSTSGTVLVAMNDGTGTMRPSVRAAPFIGDRTSAVLPGVSAQVFADFNDDGQLDFVTLTGAGAEVFLGRSGGGFTPGQFLPASAPNFVKVADVNGDGIPDVVIGNGDLVVYLGNGDGTFRPAPASPVPPPGGYSIENATLADVNNDGHLDAVATMQLGGTGIFTLYFAVFFGDGQGGFEFNANTIIPVQFGLSGLVVDDTIPEISATLGDFNGDGKLDLLVPTEAGGVYSLTDYLGNGNGTFTPGPVIYSGTSAAYDELLLGDLNGDGRLDIVGFNAGGSLTADVYLGDGKGGFEQSASVNLSQGADSVGNTIYPSDLALGDFNGDGHLDLAVSYYDFFANPTEVDVFTGDGAGHFAADQSVTVGMNPFTLVSIPRAPFLDAGTFSVADQPPTAQDATATAVSGSSITIPVLERATDPSGAPLTIVGLTNPAHGVAHIVAGPPSDPADEVVVYAPLPGYSGTDSFTYTIADPDGVESTGTVTVTVTGLQPPTVTGLSPATGPAAGGTQVTIAGSNLAGATAVDFGSTQVTSFISDTASQIILSSPAGTGTVHVTVVTPGGTSPTRSVDQFSYSSSQVLPTNLSAVSGSSGIFGGIATLTATLTGSAGPLSGRTVVFTLTQGNTVQTVGQANSGGNGVATLTGVSLTGFTAGTYTGAVGARFAGDATYAPSSASGDLVVGAPASPSVSFVSPFTGPAAGGTLVTITGSNLAGATAVDFGFTQVTSFISDTASQIILSSPAGTGSVFVDVVTPAGTSPTSPFDQFSYTSPAVPTNLSTVSGTGALGGTATLTATLTASAVPLAGRIVTFTLREGGAMRTVGTASTDAHGVATLTGVSLAGLSPGAHQGAVGASFAGDSTYADASASGTLVISTGQPLLIIGEQAQFHRKTNKKGKPTGKPVLSGFVFDFSGALNPSSATNKSNYQINTITTKRVKKQTHHILHPITSFSVVYSAANDSVTLAFVGKQTFQTGGQITVVGGASGITEVSGAALPASKVFAITPRGQSIVPQ